jgi:GntR family transcriptional regulator
MEIDKNKSTPLYIQIEKQIKKKIEQGILKTHDKITSEQEISQKYDVSRSTVRKAFARLVQENLVYRKVGKGTFVSDLTINQNVSLMKGFAEKANDPHIHSLETKILKKDIVFPENDIQKLLKLNEKDKVLIIDRLRYINSEPLVKQTCILPVELFSEILSKDLTNSITKIIKEDYNYKFESYWTKMNARGSDRHISDILNIEENAPIMYIEGLTFAKNNIPIRLTKNYYRGDRFNFIVNEFHIDTKNS